MSNVEILLLAMFVLQVYNTIQRHAIIHNQLVLLGKNT